MPKKWFVASAYILFFSVIACRPCPPPDPPPDAPQSCSKWTWDAEVPSGYTMVAFGRDVWLVPTCEGQRGWWSGPPPGSILLEGVCPPH